MKKINIFLDDERDPSYVKNKLGDNYPSDWIIIRNYFDFIETINKNLHNINLISFDHDIKSFDENNNEFTGKDGVDYIINKCLDNGITFPNWYVHTNNPSGRDNIIGVILNYLKYIEGKKINWIYYYSGIINNKIVT